ncbi:hypothetical protein E4V01_21280 [Methylorubrum sp. Q1]|nr:hypothetical protein E4V01_21280 [Methylorubrum sp. Q1]
MAFVVVAWSLNWVVMKVAVQDVAPLRAVAIRTGLAALVLLPSLFAARRLVRPHRADLPVVLVIMLFHRAAFAGPMTAGLVFVPASRAKERRVTRWEHEAVLEAVQRRLDADPHAMRTRRQTVEHVFGTLKGWMGATHFQMRRLRNVATETSLQVLAYNLKPVMAILGTGPLLTALRA